MTSRDNTAALPGGTGGGTLTNGVHSHYSTEANASPLPPAPAQLLEAALEYARLGWPVFPLVPGAKNPRTRHGLNDATTDENAIREWWRRSPNANVGLACEGAGLFVVDVDTFGGKQGTKSLARLVIDLGFDPFADTLSQVTRSGGTQYLFRLPPGVAARSRASAGGYLHLDVRAHGGYIVVPPSCVDADEKGPAGIYSWVGGFDVARIQTAPERLLELLAAKPAKQAPLPVAGGSEAAPAGLSGSDPAELMERIFREAVSGVTFSSAGGNRNIRAHHLGQQLRDNGFTIVQAVGMAGRFAAACPGDGFPPAEAEQAIRSAFTQPPREPWAQPAPNRIKRPVPASDTNEAESLPDGCPAGAPGPDSLPWPFLAQEALHGPAGDFIRAVTPLIETDSASLLVQLLVGFGNAMGRGPHFTVGNTRHGGNEFAAVVGETGCGKGAGWGRVADVLRAVDPTWYSTRQYTSFPSGESIPWAVRDPQLKRKNIAPRGKPAKYEEVLGDGIDDKRLVIRYSELREVLVTMHRDANTISPTLRNAFDGELLMNAGKTNPCMVREHHISFVGHITPRELLTSIEPADLTNGLVSRFLWCVLRFERSLPNPPRLDDSVKNPLVAAFHAAMEHARIEREYERDEAAERLWEAIYPALRDRPKTLMGSITERARVHVLRLALIYAVLDRDTAIRVPHLLAGLAVWQFCESSACRVFQPLIHESDPAVRIYG